LDVGQKRLPKLGPNKNSVGQKALPESGSDLRLNNITRFSNNFSRHPKLSLYSLLRSLEQRSMLYQTGNTIRANKTPNPSGPSFVMTVACMGRFLPGHTF